MINIKSRLLIKSVRTSLELVKIICEPSSRYRLKKLRMKKDSAISKVNNYSVKDHKNNLIKILHLFIYLVRRRHVESIDIMKVERTYEPQTAKQRR